MNVRFPRHRFLAASVFTTAFWLLAPAARGLPTGDSAGTARDSIARLPSAADSTAIAQAASTLVVQSRTATPETLAAEPASARVFLGGREVFKVRSSRDGLSPEARALAIRERLTAAVRDHSVPDDSLRFVTTPEGVEVRLGRHFLWFITPGDVADVTPAELAATMAQLPERIRAGIERERASRRPLGILMSVLFALGATLAAWVLARLLLAGSRRWRAWLDHHLPRLLRGVRFRNFEVLSQAQLVGLVGAVLARLDAAAGLLLLYAYITVVFSMFPWTQGWSHLLFSFAGRQLLEVARSVGAAIPGLVVIAALVVVFRWLSALGDRFFDAVAAGTVSLGNFHPDLARPSKRLLRILLWIVAGMVAYPYIPGSDSRAVQGVSLLLGVMVSLGSTGFVGNAISGIVLTYSRSFRAGDRVRIGDQVGDVVNLGFFATKLRSLRNEEVTLPNGHVAAQPIVNYTRLAGEHGLILYTTITIGYDVDWRNVHALLIEAAERVAGIERSPRPWVYQRSLNDSHVSYELNAMTRDSHPQLQLYSRLHEEIQDAFARAGVEILSPAYHALRDANAAVLPAEPHGPRPGPGGFRVRGGPLPG